MIYPHSEEYTVRSGHWITEPGSYDLQIKNIKLSAPQGKTPCYELDLFTPDGLQTIQRCYLSPKTMKFFVNFLKTVAREELPETIEEMDEGLIKEIAEGGYFRAVFLPDTYNDKVSYKIQWFELQKVTADMWFILCENAQAAKKAAKPTDDIPF
jgi:hypothetical protein